MQSSLSCARPIRVKGSRRFGCKTAAGLLFQSDRKENWALLRLSRLHIAPKTLQSEACYAGPSDAS